MRGPGFGLLEDDDGALLVHRIEKCMRRLEDLPLDLTLTIPGALPPNPLAPLANALLEQTPRGG